MSDLISRKVLLKELSKLDITKMYFPDDFKELVKKQPISNVFNCILEQLEEELKTHVDASNIFVREIYDGMVFATEKAIEIVRKGGCDE